MSDSSRRMGLAQGRGLGLLCVPAVVAALGPVLLFTMPASAGDWKLTDSVGFGLTYRDRTGSDAESGLVGQLTPSLSLTGRGARVNANVRYGLTANITGSSSDVRGLSHDLTATGDIEVIEDLLLIEAQARAGLVGSSATSGNVDSLNADQDGRQTYSLQVSPRLKKQLDNRYVTVVSNNSLDLVDYTGGDNQDNDESTSRTMNLGLESGPMFTTYDWDAGVTQTDTKFDDRTDTRREFSAGVGYRIDARWRLNVRAGWEDNDVETSTDDTDGVIWNAGGVWTPNPRTSVSVDYGDRYFGNTYSASATHRTRKTTLSLNASRDIANRRDTRFVDSLFFLVDQNGNPIVDPNTGQLVIVNIPQLQETDEDFLNTQLSAAVSVTGRRTNVSVTGNVASREYEVSGDDEDSYGVGISVSRRMGDGITAALRGSLDHVSGAADGDSDTYDVGLTLSKQLGRKTSASLDLLHRDRDASTSDDSYTENRIGVTISTSFL